MMLWMNSTTSCKTRWTLHQKEMQFLLLVTSMRRLELATAMWKRRLLLESLVWERNTREGTIYLISVLLMTLLLSTLSSNNIQEGSIPGKVLMGRQEFTVNSNYILLPQVKDRTSQEAVVNQHY